MAARVRSPFVLFLALLSLGFCVGYKPAQSATDSLQPFAREFWQWRAQYQPFSQDDIPRIEHPIGKRSWSAASIADQRRQLAAFDDRWRKLEPTSKTVPEQVDWRLMGSALARVHWELDITRRWERDPTFYVDQTMTAVLEELLPPPPMTEGRVDRLLQRLQDIPTILSEGRKNLHPSKPFAELAIEELRDIRPKLLTLERELNPMLPDKTRPAIQKSIEDASMAEETFRDWLQSSLAGMPAGSPVGRENYSYFLRKVALIPYTPEQLVSMSHQEWERSISFEQFEEHRDRGVAPLTLAKDFDAQKNATSRDEESIRRFLKAKDLLSIPSQMQHYTVAEIPKYLAPLAPYGELDDFTSEHRLDQPGVRWTPPPTPELGYFALASAKDPRPIIVHEGVPGHYFQLCLSWMNSDAIRRHYYDSSANEGIGFYAEEMMLEAGLFDNSPHTREIIYNFMRLRALRVEVDVKLALGEFSVEQAADYLAHAVPMDRKTAHGEAQLFSSTPGQAISYQVGKLQILRFLAAAKAKQGAHFQLREFHDFLWRNGNVPIALQEWEYLGLKQDVPDFESLAH